MIRLRNATRHRREYDAELEVDGTVVGRVHRAENSKALGFR